MASSSSSSSQFNSASVSQSWKHEVFLSFRGEDTRKGFVDHLYTALVQQGIQTYKDDETLARGESIGPALRKAIQESRIAIIVFSKNYADSSWCLDELAYIIECKEKRGQIVIPVFYDIDPSCVRKQKRKYEEAFKKHESDNNNNNNKTESWRKALVEASNLSGWVLNDFANGHEAKCIKDIVEKISDRLPQLIPNVNKDLIGIETRLQDLKLELDIGAGGVRIVGIWGVGGGGKTTLASALYMESSNQFEACCLLENIREESKTHGLKKLQANMLSLLLKKDVMIGSEIEGKREIKRSLCHKNVLVVLDDVNERKQLEALAGSHDWFGEGSRIIITTRDKHLLTRHADTIHEVSLLSDDEAGKLFSRHAFKKDEPEEDYKTLSQEVVSYASRLPLALEILGSFLYDKNKDEWRSTLNKLKCIPDADVMERLIISYDGLKDEEKEVFLDIACLFRGHFPIDEAIRVLDACGLHSGIGVKVLEQRSLINVSDGKIGMHDLIREMAHYIVKREFPKNPENRSRIWMSEDIVNLCAMGSAAPSMETEALALHDPEIKFWEAESSDDNHQRLHDLIANMKKLRFMDWAWFPLSSLPSNFLPTNLGCLKLNSSNVIQLCEGYKCLPNLKILDLGGSTDLMMTPNFKGFPRLERLILYGCERLEEIHPSIGYHEMLVYVNMKRCKKLKTFPPIIRMNRLETLDLSFCSELRKFPDIQSKMDSLVNLYLNCSGIEIIAPSVGQFCTNLVTFDLSNCKMLKRIEGNFHRLKRLKYLNLSSWQLEKLAWDFFYEECCLEVLSLTIKNQESALQCFRENNSTSLKLPQFPRFLKKLDLSWCHLEDGDIPSDMSRLLNLQVLDLSGNRFSRLHSSLSQIPCLKFLNLSWCPQLVELPDLPSSIAILKAECCNSLQRVGDLSNCTLLWKVSMWRENENKLIDADRVVHSILQANLVEDHVMSIVLPQVRPTDLCRENITLELPLPHNWYSDFIGFFFCANSCEQQECSIIIKQGVSSMNSQTCHDHWEEFDENLKSYKEYQMVGYVPFGSLRHVSWCNPTCTHITFQIEGLSNPKVGFVPKSKLVDSKEPPTDSSECWGEIGGYGNTFRISDDSNSSKIKIGWSPRHFNDYFGSELVIKQ